MIRLTPEDVADAERVRTLASAGRLSEAEFVRRFAPVVLPPTTVDAAPPLGLDLNLWLFFFDLGADPLLRTAPG